MMFDNAISMLNFIPQDGMSVQVVGKVQVYQKRGTYSIICSQMHEVGLGLLYQKYLELKDKLTKEGLFDEKYKKKIPEYPETVGIITASTGEAINDIVSTFNKRLPLAKLVLYPSQVQGLDAPKDLIRALNLAYQNPEIDVLIIGRGGGSFEDLNCFNDENLIRKLFLAPFPTVSAVGHEGDYTLCDFVCSHRAPTPTGAAMYLTKLKSDVLLQIDNQRIRLVNSIKKCLTDKFNNYKNYLDRLNLLTPEKIAENLNDKINHLTEQLTTCFNNYQNQLNNNLDSLNLRLRKELITDKIDYYHKEIDNLDNKNYLYLNHQITNLDDTCNHLIEKLILLNPLNIIKKGYTIVYHNDNVVYNVKELKLNDELKIKFSDGYAEAKVTKIVEE